MTKHSEARELRLLVVEDETLIAIELEDTLVELGHRVLGVASSVSKALALLDELGDGLDAALLDANLGGKSAAPVAEALQARGVPFLITSGYDGEELRQLGFDAPKLRKPCRGADISRALQALAATAPI